MRIDQINNAMLTDVRKSMEFDNNVQISFASWLGEKINNTNEQLNKADHILIQLASGQTENLHQSMITLEQAKLSFQYMEQIRNRLLTAYQDLLREQI